MIAAVTVQRSLSGQPSRGAFSQPAANSRFPDGEVPAQVPGTRKQAPGAQPVDPQGAHRRRARVARSVERSPWFSMRRRALPASAKKWSGAITSRPRWAGGTRGAGRERRPERSRRQPRRRVRRRSHLAGSPGLGEVLGCGAGQIDGLVLGCDASSSGENSTRRSQRRRGRPLTGSAIAKWDLPWPSQPPADDGRRTTAGTPRVSDDRPGG